jgi:YD repeat-containing protein
MVSLLRPVETHSSKPVDVKTEAHKIAHGDAASAIHGLHNDLSKMSAQERKGLYTALQGELKDHKDVLPNLTLSDDHGHKHIKVTENGKTHDFDVDNRRERVASATPAEAAAANQNRDAAGKPLKSDGKPDVSPGGADTKASPGETPGAAKPAGGDNAVADPKHGQPDATITGSDGKTRKYNHQGQLVEETRADANSRDITRWDPKNPNYDQPTYQYHRDQNSSTETNTKYSAEGKLLSQQTRDSNKDRTETTTVDAKGDKTVETKRFSDGSVTTTKTDDKGEYYHKDEKRDGSYTLRATDRLTGNTSNETYDAKTGKRDLIVKHDATGETVNESHTSPEAPPREEPKLVGTPPMERPTPEQQKGPPGQTVESEDHRTARRYDSQGRLVEERRVDDRGQLTDKRTYDEKNPDYSKPTYEFHEDRAGRSETKTKYDASGAAVRTESKTVDKNDDSSHSTVTENGKVVSDITTDKDGWKRTATVGNGDTETITHTYKDGRTVSTKSNEARGEYYHREQEQDGTYKETSTDKETGNQTVDSNDAKTKTLHTVITNPKGGLVSDTLTVPNDRGGTTTTIKDAKGQIYRKSSDRDGEFTEDKLDRTTGQTTHVISDRDGKNVSTRVEDANGEQLSDVQVVVDRAGVTHTFKTDASGRQFYTKEQQPNGSYTERTDDFSTGTKTSGNRTTVTYDGPTGLTTTKVQDKNWDVTSITKDQREPYVAPAPEKPATIVTPQQASRNDMWRQFSDVAKQDPKRIFEGPDGRHYRYIPLDNERGRLFNMDVR